MHRHRPVRRTVQVVGDGAKNRALALRDGELMCLENVRFHAGETKNDPQLCKELAALCQVYVNDAFGTAHRAHASTAGIAQHARADRGAPGTPSTKLCDVRPIRQVVLAAPV